MSSFTTGSNANIISRNTGSSFAEVYRMLESGKMPTTVADDYRAKKAEIKKKTTSQSFVPPPFSMIPPLPKSATVPDYIKRAILVGMRLNTVKYWDEEKKNYSEASNTLNYVTYPRDTVCYQMCVNYLGSAKSHLLDLARDSIMTSGNEKALWDRLILNVTRHSRTSSVIKYNFNAMKKYIKVIPKPNSFPTTLDEFTYTPTWNSSAGMPWLTKSKKQVAKSLVQKVGFLFDNANDLNFLNTYIQEHPEEITVMLKNKTEVQSMADFLKKTRPYFVFPAAFQTLYSQFFETCLSNLISFQHDPESAYLPGWSWCATDSNPKGGATVIYSRCIGLMPYEPMLAIYSDDIHIFVRTPTGVHVLVPDVQGLDGEGRVSDINNLTTIATSIAHTKDIRWNRIGAYAIKHAFTQPVLLAHKVVIQKDLGFASGGPGTTFFGTMKVLNSVSQALENYDWAGSFEQFPQHMAQIFEKHHMTLHPETLSWHHFLHPDNRPVILPTTFPILGQYLTRIFVLGHPHFIAIPKQEDLFASLINPLISRSDEEVVRLRKLINRCIGLVVSGGYYYEDFYVLCRRYYQYLTSKCPDVLDMEIETRQGYEDNKEVIQAFFDVQSMKYKSFPPRSFFVKLYTGQKDSLLDIADAFVYKFSDEHMYSQQADQGGKLVPFTESFFNAASKPEESDFFNFYQTPLQRADRKEDNELDIYDNLSEHRGVLQTGNIVFDREKVITVASTLGPIIKDNFSAVVNLPKRADPMYVPTGKPYTPKQRKRDVERRDRKRQRHLAGEDEEDRPATPSEYAESEYAISDTQSSVPTEDFELDTDMVPDYEYETDIFRS